MMRNEPSFAPRFKPMEESVRNRSLNRILREGKHKAATAVLTFTLCLAASADSALGQTNNPLEPTEPVHKAIPVHLDATSGDIQVGRTIYSGANPGLHLLALKRQPQQDPNQQDTPELIKDQVVTDTTSANQFLLNLLTNTDTNDALVIANGVGNYEISVSDLAPNLERFGGQVDLEQQGGAIPLIFLGNGGLNKGGALQRGYSTFPIDGYLALDSNSNYKFIQTDYVRYDITPDGTITIGGIAYTAAASSWKGSCDGSNSLRLVVVNRETLQMTANKSYCTAAGDDQIGYLEGDLGGFNSEANLVFIGTNGHPIPANWNFLTGAVSSTGMAGDSRLTSFASEIANFGGYYETAVYLSPTDTYSLVGAAAPPSYVAQPRSRARESSSVYPGHPTGELHGVLARGRGNWYSPVNADTSGTANLDFYDKVLAQVAVPSANSNIPNSNYTFPPYTTDANYSDELNAFTSISTRICQATESDNNPDCSTFNPRNDYADTNIAISNYLINLQDIKGPGGADCSQPANSGLAFCQIWQQLSTEFQAVANIRNFQANLGKLGTIQGEDDLFDLINIWQTVEATLPTPPSSAAATSSLVSPIVNLVLGIGASAPTPLAPLFGLVDTFFNFGMSMTTDPSGNQTASLATPIANLANQAQDNFHAQLDTLGTQFDLIYENWPKMQPLGALLASGTPAWSWGDPTSTASAISARLNPAIRQSMYRSLMPAVYAIGSYVPNSPRNCSGNGGQNGWPVWGQTPLWQEPNAYGVNDGAYGCGGETPVVQPFNAITPAYFPYTYPTDSANPWENDPRTGTILASTSWLAISLQSSPTNSGQYGVYNPPDPSLLSTLFTPIGQNSPDGNAGLGVYRPAFFEGWPFPRVTCNLSFGDYNGYASNGGCDWGTATLSGGTFPPSPVTPPAEFSDVPSTAPYFDAANLMFLAGVTDGCVGSSDPSTRMFCPNDSVTREEMAAFIVRAVTGTTTPAIYNPTPFFTDVPTTNTFFPHIQKMMELGITDGCATGLFCPTDTVPRWQMAIFTVRARLALYGASFSYNSTPYFADVPTNVEGNGIPFPFIQRSYEENITAGCGINPLVYCPDELVTRGQMASFIMRALFNETSTLGPTAPMLTGVSPNTMATTVGAQITVTITGVSTNFQTGDMVTVPSGMLAVSNVVVNSATSISATLTANANVVAGPQALVVTSGGQNLTLPLAIKVGTY